jgi:4-hydroxy-tetrahydrodipicolinate reductase
MARSKRGAFMNEKIRIIQYGVGQMGINMVRLSQSKPRVRVVGAIDCDEAKIGRDLGEVASVGRKLGVTIQFPPEKVLANIEADVVLHATTAFMDDAFPQLMPVLDSKINAIAIMSGLTCQCSMANIFPVLPKPGSVSV